MPNQHKTKEKSPKQTAGVIYSVMNKQSFAYHSSDVIDMFLVFAKEVICFFSKRNTLVSLLSVNEALPSGMMTTFPDSSIVRRALSSKPLLSPSSSVFSETMRTISCFFSQGCSFKQFCQSYIQLFDGSIFNLI